MVFIHDILDSDKRGYVDCAWVWESIVGWVEVNDGYGAREGREELVFSIAVG